MSRDIIKVQYPVLDHSESIANIGIQKQTVNPENGITIEDAFTNIHTDVFFIIENNKAVNSDLTVKAGDAYPNSMLGDITIEIPVGVSAIYIQDLARFQKTDYSLDIDFAKDFEGSIYAVAKWAGVRN